MSIFVAIDRHDHPLPRFHLVCTKKDDISLLENILTATRGSIEEETENVITAGEVGEALLAGIQLIFYEDLASKLEPSAKEREALKFDLSDVQEGEWRTIYRYRKYNDVEKVKIYRSF